MKRDTDTEIESDADPASPPATTVASRPLNGHDDESVVFEERNQIRKTKPRAKIVFSDEDE